jgi:hypothetical protein
MAVGKNHTAAEQANDTGEKPHPCEFTHFPIPPVFGLLDMQMTLHQYGAWLTRLHFLVGALVLFRGSNTLPARPWYLRGLENRVVPGDSELQGYATYRALHRADEAGQGCPGTMGDIIQANDLVTKTLVSDKNGTLPLSTFTGLKCTAQFTDFPVSGTFGIDGRAEAYTQGNDHGMGDATV